MNKTLEQIDAEIAALQAERKRLTSPFYEGQPCLFSDYGKTWEAGTFKMEEGGLFYDDCDYPWRYCKPDTVSRLAPIRHDGSDKKQVDDNVFVIYETVNGDRRGCRSGFLNWKCVKYYAVLEWWPEGYEG
jgi:hypothetical protein